MTTSSTTTARIISDLPLLSDSDLEQVAAYIQALQQTYAALDK